MKIKKIVKRINDYKIDHTTGETIYWLWNCALAKLIRHKSYDLQFEEIKLDKDEKKYVVRKSGHNIFIFGNIPYYDIGGGQRSSQLAKTFNNMGFPVYYIYGFKSSESKIYNIPMPMQMHEYIDNVKISSLSKIMREDDLVIFEAPVIKYSKFIDLAVEKKAKIIYENIDNWETSLGNGVLHKETLNKMLINADLLVGTAKPLVNQLKDYCKELKIQKNIVYLANAVDDQLFSGLKKYEKPEDIVTDKKTLIYYGSLWGEWFDWDLIYKIARKHKNYSINLIGDYKNISDKVKSAPSNVHFLGLKKQYELPAYLYYSDFAMIPFKPGKIGDYVSPLKIFEYIAMYKTVLTTKLPDISGYPNTYYGNTPEEWCNFIENGKKPNEDDADEFIYENSWVSRIHGMIQNVYPEFSKECEEKYYNKISVVVLNYNNKGIIDKCVDSLIRNNDRYNYEIVIVDNQSQDGSYEQLKEKYKNKIVLVKNEKNGCSSGRNLGVTSSHGDFLIFLDSDQWAMHKYWLDPYFEIMKNASNVGLIGWAAGWFNKYGKSYHVVDSFNYRYMPQCGICRNDIGYLGSGGMFIKRELFDKIKGFDLYYDPTCYEDTDLSLSVRNAGYEIYYCPFLGVMHLPHQTTNAGSPEHRKLTNQKQEYFTKKWKKQNPDLLKYIK
jgi:O-antigen biosynthesis protein